MERRLILYSNPSTPLGFRYIKMEEPLLELILIQDNVTWGKRQRTYYVSQTSRNRNEPHRLGDWQVP